MPIVNKDIILVTGCAGFIGYHLCKNLLKKNLMVIGFDNINDYYDVNLKKSRLKKLEEQKNNERSEWKFIFGNLEDKEKIDEIFKNYSPKVVIHLAAQAGVRYSLENPISYINSNIYGFINILEACKDNSVKNLIYASSSSVYGGNEKIPFSEKDAVNHPVSLYAATKRSNEMMAHSYSHLYNLPCIGIRLFTVYGPWGRPDMAPMIFTKSILENKPIQIFNNGEMWRDFTYVDDVIFCIESLIDKAPLPDLNFNKMEPDPSRSWAPHKIFNIGNSGSVKLTNFISLLENELQIKAVKIFKEMQLGDVISTSADTKLLEDFIGKKTTTTIDIGIKKFVSWYKSYYC